MKSYTDIEQSKKLAEFLPLESADMKWYFWKGEIDAPKTPTFGYSKTAAESYKDTEAVYLPCWSLSALLDVLPEYNLQKIYCGNIKVGERIVIYPYDEHYMSDYYDNVVDACVSMIEYLHELKML